MQLLPPGWAFSTRMLPEIETPEATEAPPLSYASQSIDLSNLNQYPWGRLLRDTLMSIGASDIKTIDCELDSSDVTFRIVTETKRLWVSIGGKYGTEWYVKWIRNYDESEIYYYVTAESVIYEERLYSHG